MRFYSTKYVFAIISVVSSRQSYDVLPMHELIADNVLSLTQYNTKLQHYNTQNTT